MAACGYCGATILFGGTRDGDVRFCNEKCHSNGYVALAAQQMPDDLVSQQVWDVHQGSCPKCGGAGPIDVHNSHRVWSALVMTSWNSRPHVACRSCGMKAQLADTVFCMALGWWGFPWGLVMTPVQIVRNVSGLLRSAGATAPSPELERMVRLHIAANAIQAHANQANAARQDA